MLGRIIGEIFKNCRIGKIKNILGSGLVYVCFEFEKGKRELEFGSNLSATHPSSGKKI